MELLKLLRSYTSPVFPRVVFSPQLVWPRADEEMPSTGSEIPRLCTVVRKANPENAVIAEMSVLRGVSRIISIQHVCAIVYSDLCLVHVGCRLWLELWAFLRRTRQPWVRFRIKYVTMDFTE